MKNHNSDREVPCALQHSISPDQKKMDKLSPLVCRRAFQFWVAYIRPSSPGISTVERYTCPLLSCNKFHCDLDSFLIHVATCARLDNAEYWCSTCRQYERFPMYHGSDSTGQSNVMQRTGSKLKRAAEFFRDLSLRRCSRNCHHDSWPTNTADGDNLSSTHIPTNSKFELESTPPAGQELPAELVTPGEYLYQFPTKGCYELAAVPDTGMPLEPNSPSEKITMKPRFGPDDYKFVDVHDSGYNSPIDSIYPELNTPTSQQSPTKEKRQSLSSTSSPSTSTSATPPELESPLIVHSAVPTWAPGIPELDTNGATAEVTQSSTTEDFPRFFQRWQEDEPVLTAGNTSPARVLVSEHRNVFGVLCKAWMVKLSSASDLLMRIPALSVDTLLQLGLQTWHAFELGQLPRSFDSTFALILVAVTCAYVQHEGRDLSYWNGLFQNILEWQNTLPNADDRTVLKQIIEKVMAQAQETSGIPSTADSTSTPLRATHAGNQLSPHHPLCNEHVHLEQTLMVGQPLEESRDITALLQRLRSGKLFLAYLQFLDDVGFEETAWRSMRYRATSSWHAYQHVDNVKHMRRSITWNLTQLSDMKYFQDEIIAIDDDIRKGMLHSVREVELTLLGLCKRRCRDEASYGRYRSIITTVCDQAMMKVGPQWRIGHHAAELVVIKAYGSDFATSTRPQSSKRSLDQQPSPPSAYAGSGYVYGSSIKPTSMISDNMLVPAPLFSQVSPGPEHATTDCPYCNQPQSTSNINRHIKAFHQNQKDDFPCHNPICEKTFTRKDNRDRHMREMHGNSSTRRGANKRQKTSELNR